MIELQAPRSIQPTLKWLPIGYEIKRHHGKGSLTPTPHPLHGQGAFSLCGVIRMGRNTPLPLARVQWERGLGGEGNKHLAGFSNFAQTTRLINIEIAGVG